MWSDVGNACYMELLFVDAKGAATLTRAGEVSVGGGGESATGDAAATVAWTLTGHCSQRHVCQISLSLLSLF